MVCVNLLDEAARKHIQIDLPALADHLGVPVVGISAGREEGLDHLMEVLDGLLAAQVPPAPRPVRYPPAVEFAAAKLRPLLETRLHGQLDHRWTALRLLEGDPTLPPSLARHLDWDPRSDQVFQLALAQAREQLVRSGVDDLGSTLAASLVQAAHEAAEAALPQGSAVSGGERLDRLLTARATGIPAMLLLLAGVLWLTIEGANYPSQLLSSGLFWVQDRLTDLFAWLHAPEWLHGALVLGVYRVLAWVVSVMLPPMAIFFPLFTLLEDFGYLPRVAFLLDHAFQKAKACGKQALTMCIVNIILLFAILQIIPASTHMAIQTALCACLGSTPQAPEYLLWSWPRTLRALKSPHRRGALLSNKMPGKLAHDLVDFARSADKSLTISEICCIM